MGLPLDELALRRSLTLAAVDASVNQHESVMKEKHAHDGLADDVALFRYWSWVNGNYSRGNSTS